MRLKAMQTGKLVLFMCALAATARAQEPLWVPEVFFIHTEKHLANADYATFSKDAKFIEVHSSVPDETNGPTETGYVRYDCETGKSDGALQGDFESYSLPGIPKLLIGKGVLSTRFSSLKKFVLAKTEDCFHLLDREEKPLYRFPSESADDAWFYCNDEFLMITNKKGFRLYSTKSGEIKLDIDLGYRPRSIRHSKKDKYLAAHFAENPFDLSFGVICEIIDATTGKRISSFKGNLDTFSEEEDFFTIRTTTRHKNEDRNSLEMRKLPSCELIADFKNAHSASFVQKDALALIEEFVDHKYRIFAWDVQNNRCIWSSCVADQKWFLNRIIGQNKVICIQDDDGKARILDIATGRTLFDFRDARKFPEFAKQDLKKINFTFAHNSIRFLTYWHLEDDHRKMQVIVWKPTRAIE